MQEYPALRLFDSPFRFLGTRTCFAFLLLLGFAVASPLSTPSEANLIQNGGFESGPEPGQWMELGMGSTAMTGWVVTRGTVDYVGINWAAANGSRSVGLNGSNPGGVAQTFATVNGGEYTVRFFLSGDPFTAPTIKHVRVEAGGEFQEYEFDNIHAWPWDMLWTEHTFTFTADGTATTLELYSLETDPDTDDAGPAIDSVVVEGPTVGVERDPRAGILLRAPYPNPARAGVWITYAVPSDSPVRLSVSDVQGREVALIDQGIRSEGIYSRRWDGRTARGRAPAGVYFIRLAAPGATQVRKVVLSPESLPE